MFSKSSASENETKGINLIKIDYNPERHLCRIRAHKGSKNNMPLDSQ